MEYDTIAIGKRIGVARKAKHYTQEDVSSNVGINVKHLSDIERGVTGTSLKVLVQLCNLLDVTPNYLIAGNIFDSENSLNPLLKQLTPKQMCHAEKILKAYIESCFDNS